MTEEEREAIYKALLGDVSMLAPGDAAREMLEESAARQLEELEPIINKMLTEAWKAGTVSLPTR